MGGEPSSETESICAWILEWVQAVVEAESLEERETQAMVLGMKLPDRIRPLEARALRAEQAWAAGLERQA